MVEILLLLVFADLALDQDGLPGVVPGDDKFIVHSCKAN